MLGTMQAAPAHSTAHEDHGGGDEGDEAGGGGARGGSVLQLPQLAGLMHASLSSALRTAAASQQLHRRQGHYAEGLSKGDAVVAMQNFLNSLEATDQNFHVGGCRWDRRLVLSSPVIVPRNGCEINRHRASRKLTTAVATLSILLRLSLLNNTSASGAARNTTLCVI
jgi:hypothetical protein